MQSHCANVFGSSTQTVTAFVTPEISHRGGLLGENRVFEVFV